MDLDRVPVELFEVQVEDIIKGLAPVIPTKKVHPPPILRCTNGGTLGHETNDRKMIFLRHERRNLELLTQHPPPYLHTPCRADGKVP